MLVMKFPELSTLISNVKSARVIVYFEAVAGPKTSRFQVELKLVQKINR